MEALRVQRSLGTYWSLTSDCFTFKVEPPPRPLTRRGILVMVNTLFDPLGFVAPVTEVGKLILRELMSVERSWDNPVSAETESNFVSWKDPTRSW